MSNLSKKVTILMPVYNGELYLKQAIESLLKQTYPDFDILIINDGSTDRTEDIINSFKDKKIIYISNQSNIGLIRTLNKGLSLVKGEYIIRMDADDISHENRVKEQVKYMDLNPDIAASGTWIEVFPIPKYKKKIIKTSCDPEKIKTILLFKNALVHPTIILRNSIIKEMKYQYDPNHEAAEDYGLWLKMSSNHKLGNIQKALLKYRINEFGITQNAEKNVKERDDILSSIYKETFEYLNVNYSSDDLKRFRIFIAGRTLINEQEIQKLVQFLSSLRKAAEKKDYNILEFNRQIKNFYVCYNLNNNIPLITMHKTCKKNFDDFISCNIFDLSFYLIRLYVHKYKNVTV